MINMIISLIILKDHFPQFFSKYDASGSETEILRSATRLEDDVWYHVDIVHLNGKLDIYLDSKVRLS